MASVIQQHPPSSPSNDFDSAKLSNASATVPPAMDRTISVATIDMHIPGAWVGTNPPTPAPIQEDMAYLGQQLKTLPSTVQGYIPSREQAAQHASNLKEMAAASVPASVANAATNILPSSVQPTMSPTAAEAAPPVPSTDANPIPTTTNTIEHKDPSLPETDTSATSPTLTDKAAAILPAGALSAAAAILPSSMNPTSSPTAADAEPPAALKDIPSKGSEIEFTSESPKEGKLAESSWTEKIVPGGALAAAGTYLPTSLNPFAKNEDEAPTPYGTHEGLNAPLPPIPATSDTALPNSTASMRSDPKPLVGSTVSPDEDVQEALANTKSPDDFKVEISPTEPTTEPATSIVDQAKTATGTIGDETSIIDSTHAVGGTTPIPTPAEEPSTKRGKMATVLGGGAVGAFAVDHGLKKQKEEASAVPTNGSRLIETNDSFQHVITPATPFAGEHEGELWQKKGISEGASKLDTKKSKKERSGSVSAGEASPSSPNKTGVFSGIRKLTKKRQGSKSRGHSRDVSMDDNKPEETFSPTTHQASVDSQDSNSSGPGFSPSSPTKKQHNVLHKDPPASHQPSLDTDAVADHVDPAPKANNGSVNTPSLLANPFSLTAPPSSPSKASIKDKLKGEFMVVSGTLTRDSGLKEAGKKMKEGTL